MRYRKLTLGTLAAVSITGASILGANTTLAAGADGGDFTCRMTGVPGWGYVTSSYNHPTRAHYATASGKGQQTVHKGPGENAVASTGRGISGNACHYGFD